MQLRGEAARANVVDAAHEAGVEVARRRAGCRKVVFGSALEITAPRADALAGFEHDARGAIAFDQNARHRRAGANRRRRPRRAALASASHSAPMPPLGCDSPASPAADSAARRYSSVNTVPGERGPKFAPSTASKPSAPLSAARIEVLFEQIVDIHAADAQQLAHVAPPELAYLPADPQQREPIRPVGRAEARRHAREHAARAPRRSAACAP